MKNFHRRSGFSLLQVWISGLLFIVMMGVIIQASQGVLSISQKAFRHQKIANSLDAWMFPFRNAAFESPLLAVGLQQRDVEDLSGDSYQQEWLINQVDSMTKRIEFWLWNSEISDSPLIQWQFIKLKKGEQP